MKAEDKVKIEKIEAIFKKFIEEIEAIRHDRDEKIQAIIKKYEDSKIKNVLDDIKNLKD